MATSTQPPVPVHTTLPQDFHFTYKVLPGYFFQSEPDTNDLEFDFRTSNFGLIPRSYDNEADPQAPQWRRFESHIRAKAASLSAGVLVKVLFLGRHGQGWHNVAETKYGTRAWDHYYSFLPSLSPLHWADAHLTPLGHQQALDVHTLWTQHLAHAIPTPESFYVSPLTRTIQTADLTFQSLPLPAHKPYAPVIKETLREVLGVHTCDRRSPKTHLVQTFPHVLFEPKFTQTDELWQPHYREPRAARRYRLATLLDDIFARDENVFLSLTAHSGAIASLLEVVGHRAFALETGGVVPVVVVGERVEGGREVPGWEESDGPVVMWTEEERAREMGEVVG